MSLNTRRLFKKLESTLIKWGFTRKGIITNKNGEWLLLSQLIIIFAHGLHSWPSISNSGVQWISYIKTTGLIIFIFGGTLATKAFIDLGSNLSPLPEPIKSSKLIVENSYRNCRHPLYKSLIIISSGINLYKLSILHLFLLIVLILILKKKATREESKLKIIHKDYTSYMKHTPAIVKSVPFLDWRS